MPCRKDTSTSAVVPSYALVVFQCSISASGALGIGLEKTLIFCMMACVVDLCVQVGDR